MCKALWDLREQRQDGRPVLSRAGLEREKPIDLFQVKAQHKGDRYEAPLRAYKKLVKTNQRAGAYAMPLAAVMANLAAP